MSRILVIDDDKHVCLSIRAVLEGQGHEVETVNGVDAGVALQQQGAFDAAIIDLILPDKDGLEAIREFRKSFPDTRIIAISGGGSIVKKNYLPAAMSMGADQMLEKPFEGEQLVLAVAKAINS